MRRSQVRILLAFMDPDPVVAAEQRARAALQKQIALAKRRDRRSSSLHSPSSADRLPSATTSRGTVEGFPSSSASLLDQIAFVGDSREEEDSSQAFDPFPVTDPWPDPREKDLSALHEEHSGSCAQMAEVEQDAPQNGSQSATPLSAAGSSDEPERRRASSRVEDGPVRFSKQQMKVLEAVACRKSVFMTGSAGTGKSFILSYILRVLEALCKEGSVYVTASTGLAACALGGTTLHSFAGIGLGIGSPESLVIKILRKKDLVKRWNSVEALIIDEISMIDGELFDKIEYVARRIRGNNACFGGIQLIVTGDFYQLPPVNPPNPQKYFAFEADCWQKCFDLQVELEHVFRQSDGVFVGMLNEIRKGLKTLKTLESLRMCFRVLPDDGTGIIPTRLYPLKVDVKQENLQKLNALGANIVTFTSVDKADSHAHRFMLDHMRFEKELQLCVGAQVMLIKNLDTMRGLVNGAKGVVVGFHSRYDEPQEDESKLPRSLARAVNPSGLWPVVRFNSGAIAIGPQKETAEDGGVEVVSRLQVPLILAWALSVHKCQGMTLSKVETDLSRAFEYGMVYVALSRVKDLDGLQLIGFDPSRIKVHPHVAAFFEKLSAK
jgi:ATP-dependent DNA helicase PIF1